MLSKISIKNFQSHKSTEIEFSDGLNLITGTSDSGKSSVLRAFLWVALNRPTGDSVKNWYCGKEDVVVSIEIDNHIITKRRSNGKITYKIDDQAPFEAVKTDVPQEVLDILNLSDFNFQTQHQPYFLLNDSPGEIARKLNELVGLDIIDRIFKNLNSRTIATKREVESKGEQIDRLITEISSLSWLDEADQKLEKIEKQSVLQENLTARHSVLSVVVARIADVDSKVAELKPILSTESSCILIIEKINELSAKSKILADIKSIVLKAEEAGQSIAVENEWLKVETKHLVLSAKITKFWETSSRSRSLFSLMEKLFENSELSRREKDNLIIRQKEYRDLLKQNKICPICYSNIDDSTIERITR
jgi:DNA repair protein SbcC/Rad50